MTVDRRRLSFVGTAASRPDWECLRERGLDSEFVDIPHLVRGIDFSTETPDRAIIGWPTGDRVWYQPGSLALEPASSDSGWFGREQRIVVVDWIEGRLDSEGRCIDSPLLLRWWANRIRQMEALGGPGQPAPPATHVVGGQFASHTGRVIKRLSERREIGSDSAFYAQVLTRDLATSLDSDPDTPPLLVQQSLVTDAEFRSYVFGERSITIEFRRSEPLDSVVDIHYKPADLQRSRVVQLDSEIVGAVRSTTSLRCFAVDHLNYKGSSRILEINPTFTWHWLPDAVRRKVTDTAISFLCRD